MPRAGAASLFRQLSSTMASSRAAGRLGTLAARAAQRHKHHLPQERGGLPALSYSALQLLCFCGMCCPEQSLTKGRRGP